jgi:hypothetical protein
MGLIPSPSREGLGWGGDGAKSTGKSEAKSTGKSEMRSSGKPSSRVRYLSPIPPRLVDVVNGLLAVRP